MELLTKAVPIAMLAFVVSSMLAVGLSLTVGQIVAPLRNGKLVFFALLGKFFADAGSGIRHCQTSPARPTARHRPAFAGHSCWRAVPSQAGRDRARATLHSRSGLMVLLMVLTVAYMPLVLPLLLGRRFGRPDENCAFSGSAHDASAGCRDLQ